MSLLEAGFPIDFNLPYDSIEQPSASPNIIFTNCDDILLEQPYYPGHGRSASQGSIYSVVSTVESNPETVCTQLTTPPRETPSVRQHGPLLLPKIRPQDQDIDSMGIVSHSHQQLNAHLVTPPSRPVSALKPSRSCHARSYTNPETLNKMTAYAHLSISSQTHDHDPSAPLLCSPASFIREPNHARRASSIDAATIGKYGYPTYRQMPYMPVHVPAPAVQPEFVMPSYDLRAPSPLSMAATPEPAASTSLLDFLMAPNPAASLVRTLPSYHRDASIKHFWWDVRSVRSWNTFNVTNILSLPGAAAILTTPVPAPLLPQPSMASRHPETESSLHNIYASYYLPKLNAALRISPGKPLQFSVSKKTAGMTEPLFLAHASGDEASAAIMFGGKPTARIVGLVRSFDRFNTGMRTEGNIKCVEYLRSLAALHHAMREHSCRYGFILTEIELVLVRNGSESTPFFGELEVTSVRLAAAAPDGEMIQDLSETPLTACLALWGLCQIASNHTPVGHAHYKAEIGAPAEGTRRKAKQRDSWIPQPQLAEKREAKRSRGWVWPEDAVGRKELGKRGVKYGGI